MDQDMMEALQALATGAELIDRATPVDLVTIDNLE